MRYRDFDGSTVKISEIGFGCWGIGGGWWGARDDAQSRSALDTAVGLGVNFFDTALVYGDNDSHSEKLVGEMLHRHKGGRADIRVATKIPPKNFVWPARHDTPLKEGFPRPYIRECTDRSLKNLGVESIFLQQLHVFAERWVHENDWVEEFEKLKGEGKIQNWGVSINNHDPKSALDLVRRKMVHSLQVIYNIFDQSPEDDLLPLCQKNNVAVIVRVPFDEGSLTGALTRDTQFDPKEFRANYFKGDRLRETLDRVDAIQVDLPPGTPLWQAALQYILAHPAVSTVIPGMRRAENARRNVSVSAHPPMPADLVQKLKRHRWERDYYR